MAYPHGLFSWVDISMADPAGGSKFYSDLFGWHAEDQHDPDGNYIYTMFTKDGKNTAGLGGQPQAMAEAGLPAMWNSYVNVDSVDNTIAKWTHAGGTVMMPAMDVLTSGRMAFVTDPAGGVIGLWQAEDHVGGQVFNEHGALTWNELNTRDAEAAMEFYGAALGWEFELNPGDGPPYWLIKLPGKTPGTPLSDDIYNGGILTMDENFPADIPQHWTVYFMVDDTDDMVTQAVALGGSVVVPPFDLPVGRVGIVADPQGGVFTLMSMPTANDG
jgi:predicted enzyme related to lactoylglutathione lyase